MHLQVFKDNPAINLYKRLDFVVVDETRTHYIMERQVVRNNTKNRPATCIRETKSHE